MPIFGRSKNSNRSSDERPDTKPLAIKPTDRKRTRVGWATDVGKVRRHNEDAVLIMESYQEGGKALPPFGLFVLADGMGGHQFGEVASALAARAVVGHVTQQVHLRLLSEDPDPKKLSLDEILTEAVGAANDAVASNVPGGGTTLTCALMVGQDIHIAHVGDSRAYLVTKGGLEQITRDHSLVDRLVEMGQITIDEAAKHPQKNVLYRAVGQGGALEVDTYRSAIPARGGLLLCSDGLWGLLDDDEMARIIKESYSPQAACEMLVMAANDAGGKDNITAILVEPPITS